MGVWISRGWGGRRKGGARLSDAGNVGKGWKAGVHGSRADLGAMNPEATIRSAFPVNPVPKDFFRDADLPMQDMQMELANRVRGRPWPSLSLMDWRMIGGSPASWREYLRPGTFAYYVPSILTDTLPEPAFLHLALEAILPSNRERRPRGGWWFGFADAFNDCQRQAIRDFVAGLREASPGVLDIRDEELVSVAGAIWA